MFITCPQVSKDKLNYYMPALVSPPPQICLSFVLCKCHSSLEICFVCCCFVGFTNANVLYEVI